MQYLNVWFAIILRWIAPLVLKYFFSDFNFFLVLWLILLFSGLGIIFTTKNIKQLFTKNNSINIAIISIATLVHYLGNFYGILIGDIILTTLIIKNAPFFQKIIYARKYKSPLKKHNYILGVFLIIGVSLLSINRNTIESFNLLYILIPLCSAIAWAYLMIFVGTVQKPIQTLSIWNLLSGCVILIYFLLRYGNISIFSEIPWYYYIIFLALGFLPTLIAPILRSKSIETLGDKIIYFDYITPIITIIWSILLFKTELSTINIIGIGIVLVSIIICSYKDEQLYRESEEYLNDTVVFEWESKDTIANLIQKEADTDIQPHSQSCK